MNGKSLLNADLRNNKNHIVILVLIIFFIAVLSSNAISAFELEDEKTLDYPVDTVRINMTATGISVFANNNGGLQWDIYQYINQEILNAGSNITSLKKGINDICNEYGASNPKIIVETPYGEDCFIFTSKAVGISMEPTIHDRAKMVVNKTQDIHVNDIVIAEHPDGTGTICKRVAKIEQGKAYLISDNVNGTFEKNGKTYKYEGIRTWVNVSDIEGVVIDIDDDNEATSSGISVIENNLDSYESENENFSIPLDENHYLSGEGEISQIDSNDSYYEFEELNSTHSEYKSYRVEMKNGTWYDLNVFKVEFDTPNAIDQYNVFYDKDIEWAILGLGDKGDYERYLISISDSSNRPIYRNTKFLETLIHEK